MKFLYLIFILIKSIEDSDESEEYLDEFLDESNLDEVSLG